MRNQWLEDRLQALRGAGRTKTGLARALGWASARVTEVLKGERSIKADEVQKIARYLDWPAETVLAHIAGAGAADAGAPRAGFADNPPIAAVLPNARPSQFGGRSLPVYGAGRGGSEGFLNHDPSQAVDWTWTPPELAGVKDAFALFVDGDSMTDAGLREGATVHVHPHRKPRPGDYCVIVKKDSSVLIKRFEGQRGGKIELWQSNPRDTFTGPAADIIALFTITSVNFLR